MAILDDLNVGQKISILIEDELFNATVYDKSTRETSVEIATHYTIDVDNTDWSISLSRNTKKKDGGNK